MSLPGLPDSAFFAVFDGHGGKTVSIESATRLVPAIFNTDIFKTGDKSADTLAKALQAGFLSLDAELRARHVQVERDSSGSTAITLFITPTHLIFGNCGDSRGILASNDTVAFDTKDHKPNDQEERLRIRGAGGWVEQGRVCGNLAVSRALGDFQCGAFCFCWGFVGSFLRPGANLVSPFRFKSNTDLPAEAQMVSVVPECTVIPRTPQDNFVVLACDGIWDVMTNEQARHFVACHLKAGVPPHQICERMLEHCLDLGSRDNMSAIVVLLPNAPKPIEGFQLPLFHESVPQPDDDFDDKLPAFLRASLAAGQAQKTAEAAEAAKAAAEANPTDETNAAAAAEDKDEHHSSDEDFPLK